MTVLSYLLPFANMARADVHAFAQRVRETPGSRLWHGQTSSADPTHPFVEAAGAGLSVPAGIGVTLTPLRHPFEAAIQVRSLAAVTGRSVVAGFGPGAPAFQRALLGAAYASPLTLMREYLETVRELVAGRQVVRHGRYVHCEGALTGEPGPAIEVGAGVLRPRMATVAGECADVAISWMTPAAYLAESLGPALAEGADRVGRERPRTVAIIGVGTDRADPAQQVMAAHGRHLRQPHYRDMLRTAGVPVPATGIRALAQAVVTSGAFLHGTPEQIAAGLHDFARAGVDEVVLNLSATCVLADVPTALQDAAQIVQAFADHAPHGPGLSPTRPTKDPHVIAVR